MLFSRDNSLFSSVMDYLSVEKGWFSPYLFASGRRPVIPRSVKPDIVFCHGPFLSGTSFVYRLNPLVRLVRPSYHRVADDLALFVSHHAIHISAQATTSSAKPCSRNPPR